jgi:hypothetical protein
MKVKVFLFNILILVPAFLLLPAIAFAQELEPVVETDKGYAGFDQLEVIFGNIVSVITVVAGFAVFFALLIGGFRYMTAQGDPKAMTAARSSITWAVVGLAFIILSWLILLFISEFTGLPLTKFCIPGVGKGC